MRSRLRSRERAPSCWSVNPGLHGPAASRGRAHERVPRHGRVRVVRLDVVRRRCADRARRSGDGTRAPSPRQCACAQCERPRRRRGAALRPGAGSMKPRHRRFAWIGVGVLALAGAVALVLNAFQSNLVFFFSPSQVVAKEAPQGRAFRIGGLVEPGSFKRDANTLTVRFRVTDTAQTIPVVYTGLLPDLFKEGKGVVAQGTLEPDGSFRATEVLAKH